MTARKIIVAISSLALLLFGTTAVGAQDRTLDQNDPSSRTFTPLRHVLNVVAEESGLDPLDIVSQLRDGLTLADIITASGGDVDQVIAATVEHLTTDIEQAVAEGRITQERGNRLLDNLEDVITRGMNGELFPNRLDRGALRRGSERILIQAVADATDLLPPQIVAQVREGATLTDIITANGGDVVAVVDAAVAEATEQINAAVADGRLGQEQADELIANLPDIYAQAVNGDLRAERLENRIGRGVLALAAEQTGLDRLEIVQQLREGSTLADILTANNVDPAVFIETAVARLTDQAAQAVANGRITQEQADQLVQTFRERLTERMTQTNAA